MGRPKKTEPRIKQLNVSLTENELRNIEHRAMAVGMRPVHFSRTLLLDDNKKVVVPTSNSDGNNARLIHTQLIRLGNNLNQILRHLHMTGDPLPSDLEPLLADIRKLIARVSP